jgi:2-polyprenyl-6-methoxyphenol hydroxylase-like FAD-dependent oxidoreductase
MAARIGKDGMWRISYGEVPGLSTEEYRKRLPWKFETMLPGHPKPDQYRVTNFSPYKVHQRCSKHMRVGRFLLAADAAHLCNPLYVANSSSPYLILTISSGGLGLTGGIADVGGLIDCLLGIYNGKAGPEILDKYDEVRRDVYHKIVDPISSENIKRMYQDPETAFEKDKFLQLLASIANDPEKSREFQLVGISFTF